MEKLNKLDIALINNINISAIANNLVIINPKNKNEVEDVMINTIMNEIDNPAVQVLINKLGNNITDALIYYFIYEFKPKYPSEKLKIFNKILEIL